MMINEAGRREISDILFVSDLDGTLLDENAELSAYTLKTLTRLIGLGLNFTVATARTAATAKEILKGLPLKYPVVLMSGALTCELSTGRYTDVAKIDSEVFGRVCGILRECGLAGFVYTIEDGAMHTYYENLDAPHLRAFHDERVRKYGKKFEKCDDFAGLSGNCPIYFSTSDTEARLGECARRLRALDGINVEYYRDIYVENHMYLEVSDSRASKYNAAVKLRQSLGFSELRAFGDNLNDLPLFRACDFSYAVANAKEDVKAAADLVVGSNTCDGVANYLAEFCGDELRPPREEQK